MTTTMSCRFEGVCGAVSDGWSRRDIPAQNRDYELFEAVFGGRKTKQDKGPASPVAVPSDFCPQCGQSGRFSPGVKAGEEKSACGHSVVCSAEKQKNPWGLLPRKETQ